MKDNNTDSVIVLEKLTKEIEEKNETMTNLRGEILELNKELETLKRKKSEIAENVEKEKKFEKDKKDLTAAVEKEENIDDFIDFCKDEKERLPEYLDGSDIKKIEKIINEKDKEILALQTKLEKLEKECAAYSKETEAEKKAVELEESKLNKAIDRIKKMPAEIKTLKNGLNRYKRLIEIARKQKEYNKTVYYINEMEKIIKLIGEILEEKKQIIKEIDTKALKKTQTRHEEKKTKVAVFLENFKEEKAALERRNRAREGDILQEIERIPLEKKDKLKG